jgi:hypothetical protein
VFAKPHLHSAQKIARLYKPEQNRKPFCFHAEANSARISKADQPIKLLENHYPPPEYMLISVKYSRIQRGRVLNFQLSSGVEVQYGMRMFSGMTHSAIRLFNRETANQLWVCVSVGTVQYRCK